MQGVSLTPCIYLSMLESVLALALVPFYNFSIFYTCAGILTVTAIFHFIWNILRSKFY